MIALNFPAATNPALARALGTMLKQDFQRAVLNRIPQMAKMADDPGKPWRPVLFLCDEYHVFSTVGEHDPTGDEKFFALSRQARCIPIVATQSLSSLRSSLPGESLAGAVSRHPVSLRSVSRQLVPRMRRATDSGFAFGFTICVTSS